MIFENVLSLESGGNFQIVEDSGGIGVYYTSNGSSKKVAAAADGQGLQKAGTIAYCDQTLVLSSGILYRIRDNLILK